MSKIKCKLKVYAYHQATNNPNYLYTFKVGNKREAEKMLQRFTAIRSAWFGQYIDNFCTFQVRLR